MKERKPYDIQPKHFPNRGGTSEWQDVTGDSDIVFEYCDPLEDFKAYLHNNVLIMFGSVYIFDVQSANIILPQGFTRVIGGSLGPSDMEYFFQSGHPMINTEYGWIFDAETILSDDVAYLSIFATHVEE